MPTWNPIDKWQGAGDYAAMTRPAPAHCLLSDAERAEWERLCAWFLAWEPPPDGYALRVCTTVTDPALSHAHIREQLRAGVTGQVQRALLARLRKHWELFGGSKQCA